ncbi:MAG: hypothetical protein HQM08_10380 [Candidatus Riflebacteria bacterium]|nr:hypothetical protein [Candidatus Riflebacteria bacterium]
MSLVFSWRISNRVLIYAMISTLVVSFGSLGTFIGAHFSPEYSLIGLFLGSVLGVFVAIQETTLYGCIVGMIFGLFFSLFSYFLIDFDTAYMTVFVFSLLGAFLGEPFAYFFRESGLFSEEQMEEEGK